MSVFRLRLTDVTPSPDLPWARPTFPVFAFLVDHPDGPMLIDTGVGVGHDVIDALYSPVHYDLDEALAEHGVGVSDITTVISSHLHFDHCGQNNRFAHARVPVQRAEIEAARGAAVDGSGVGVSGRRRVNRDRRRSSCRTRSRDLCYTGPHGRSPVSAHR